MKPCVVDDSVAAAAFFPEPHAQAARRLLASGAELHAPDLVWAELGNVVWKRWHRREIDETEAVGLVRDMLTLPLTITPGAVLLEAAARLAMRTGRTVYDCLYLALAVDERTRLVTGDRRLVRALDGTPLERYVRWIGDLD